MPIPRRALKLGGKKAGNAPGTPTYAARGHGEVLDPVDLVGDREALHGRAQTALPEHLPSLDVVGPDPAVVVPSKGEPACGR